MKTAVIVALWGCVATTTVEAADKQPSIWNEIGGDRDEVAERIITFVSR
jgi:hypothetical protein